MIIYGNTVINLVLTALFVTLAFRTWKKFGSCAWQMWGGLALTGIGFLLAEIFTQMQFYQTEYWVAVEFLEGAGLACAAYYILTYEPSKKCPSFTVEQEIQRKGEITISKKAKVRRK